jgi:hypothetical protein
MVPNNFACYCALQLPLHLISSFCSLPFTQCPGTTGGRFRGVNVGGDPYPLRVAKLPAQVRPAIPTVIGGAGSPPFLTAAPETRISYNSVGPEKPFPKSHNATLPISTLPSRPKIESNLVELQAAESFCLYEI